MPLIELPNSQSAVIVSKDELTERATRAIARAYMAAAGAASNIAKQGFNELDPSTWSVLTSVPEEEQEALDGYQVALIAHMVKSWTLGDLPTTESALDLPKATFDALVTACADEFNRTTDFGPDGALDPKAATAE